MRATLLLLSALSQQVFGAGTNFLNHGDLLSGAEDPEWFESNIPFVEVPSEQIQQVYYYRWQTYKEHLAYTGAQYGYLATEFLHPAGYGAPFGGIVAAAGHHITEGRWIRDLRYGRDLINYWLAGPGQLPKPATEGLNKDTYDWAHEYSFWGATAIWKRYLITGDRNFTISHLDNLVRQYRGWDNHYNSDLGLYWQIPVWDATEYTAASYESPSGDPYHGGAGFRPTINAYQYGDALAISAIAALKGDSGVQSEYAERADALRKALQDHLWNDDKKFFMHRDRDGEQKLLDTREIMGYLPWMFNMPSEDFTAEPFSQLMDSQGFAANYGPTTVEQRSKWFMYQADGCCRWDGPSWPFATSQTLSAVETLLHNYNQSVISPSDYTKLLETYAATLYKDGKPYVAEAHHPSENRWIYDGRDHSEDYNHSTFVDNVLAGLLGLIGQVDGYLTIHPLVPSDWDYFAIENLAFQGRSVTIIWDKSGSRYGKGSGLTVFVDGRKVYQQNSLDPVSVPVTAAFASPPDLRVNIAANTQGSPQLSKAFASYTSPYDDAMRAIDGNIWRTAVPPNTRWTSYQSPNSDDYFGVDLRQTQSVCDVRLFFYKDNDGVQLPPSYDLQYLNGGNWETVPGQQRSKTPTESNQEIRIIFPAVSTSQLRVVAPNPGAGKGWGLSEFETWTAPIFKLRNENSGKLMGVDHMRDDSGAYIQQYDDNGTRDHYWQFTPVGGGWSTIKNLNSGLVLAVSSNDNSAHLIQDYEGGGTHQLWRVEAQSGGTFLIRNKDSFKVAGVDGMSTDNSANVVQYDDNGTKDHLWSLLPAAIEGC